MNKQFKINNYDTFKCTADKCSLTCCQEWRIGIDDKTYDKWQKLNLCHSVATDDGGYYIDLQKDKKCPFLNESKLCQLVIEKGEDLLSDTCANFPRQINSFEDRTEYALDTGCPAVIDILNEQKENLFLKSIDEDEVTTDFLYNIRETILHVIQDGTYTFPERLMVAFYSLLDIYEQKEVTVAKLETYSQHTVIGPVIKAIRSARFNAMDCLTESNELFLDVVHHYRKQKLYVDYLEEIACFAEQLETNYTEELCLQKWKAFEDVMKGYERLIKHYITAEVMANCLLPEMDLEDVVVGFQWITLTYVVARQVLFLKWLQQGEGALGYATVRDYLSVIARVMGYSPTDIREYIENSFEEVVWEWGYLALVVGNQKF